MVKGIFQITCSLPRTLIRTPPSNIGWESTAVMILFIFWKLRLWNKEHLKLEMVIISLETLKYYSLLFNIKTDFMPRKWLKYNGEFLILKGAHSCFEQCWVGISGGGENNQIHLLLQHISEREVHLWTVKCVIIFLHEGIINNNITKIRKKEETLTRKNEEISRRKPHTNTWKLNWNISTSDVFRKRVNLWTHSKDSTMWEFWKITTRVGARQEGRAVEGMEAPSCFAPTLVVISHHGVVFTTCLHTFTLFWSRKMSALKSFI